VADLDRNGLATLDNEGIVFALLPMNGEGVIYAKEEVIHA